MNVSKYLIACIVYLLFLFEDIIPPINHLYHNEQTYVCVKNLLKKLTGNLFI